MDFLKYQSSMSLRFYKNLDWEDLKELDEEGGIKEDELVVYDEVYRDAIIKESLFCHILLDYITKLIEVLKINNHFLLHGARMS